MGVRVEPLHLPAAVLKQLGCCEQAVAGLHKWSVLQQRPWTVQGGRPSVF